MSPLDAMRETASLFGRSPDVRVGEPAAARPAVAVGTGEDAYAPAGEARDEQSVSDLGDGNDEGAELRGRQIVERMQASARAARRPELGPDELAMVLEAATNLPDEVIARITRQATSEGRARSEQRRAVDAERFRATDLNAAIDLAATPAADERTIGLAAAHRDTGMADSAQARAGADRSAAQLAAESFPHSAADAVQAAAKTGATRPASTPARIPRPKLRNGPGRSM